VHHKSIFWPALSAAIIATVLTGHALSSREPARGDDAVQAETKLVPVDKSMHEFMEYYFQPTYRRLKPSVAATAAANPSWGAIKSDALILAEGGESAAPAHASSRSGQMERIQRRRSRLGRPALQGGEKKEFRRLSQDL
jgi:hypothetical protein